MVSSWFIISFPHTNLAWSAVDRRLDIPIRTFTNSHSRDRHKPLLNYQTCDVKICHFKDSVIFVFISHREQSNLKTCVFWDKKKLYRDYTFKRKRFKHIFSSRQRSSFLTHISICIRFPLKAIISFFPFSFFFFLFFRHTIASTQAMDWSQLLRILNETQDKDGREEVDFKSGELGFVGWSFCCFVTGQECGDVSAFVLLPWRSVEVYYYYF